MNNNINFNKKLLIYLYTFTLINIKTTHKYKNYSYLVIFLYNHILNSNNLNANLTNLIGLIDFTSLGTNKNTQRSIILQYDWLLVNYLKQLSYYYLGIKLNWVFVNLKCSLNNDFYKKFWYIFYKKKIFKIWYGKKKFTLFWFLQLYKLKDVQGFINLIQKKLYNAKLKRHKRIFYLVGFFFRILFLMKEKKNSLQGCSLFFKGKLGKKGSVRKSKFFVKVGVNSLTNKSLRINYKTYIIITITGVIGCGISIFYK